VKLFVDGEPVDEFVGALPEPQVRAWLDRALPSEEDRAVRAAVSEAREVVVQDPARAIALLDGIDPPVDLMDEVADTALLARLLLKAEAPGDLNESPAGRTYLEGIRRLAQEDFDGALEHFIQALREDRSLDDEGPRKACMAIFRRLGPEHPVTRERRSELASALYV
jgi:putative thioredoxin